MKIDEIFFCAPAYDRGNFHSCYIFYSGKDKSLFRNTFINPKVSVIHDIHFDSVNQVNIDIFGFFDDGQRMSFRQYLADLF